MDEDAAVAVDEAPPANDIDPAPEAVAEAPEAAPTAESQPADEGVADVPSDIKAPEYNHPFLNRKDVYNPPTTRLPEESELALAKAFLLKTSEKTGISLYDHLTECLVRILERKDTNDKYNVVDTFETLSADIKRRHFKPDQDLHLPGALRKAQDDIPPHINEIVAARVKLCEQAPTEEAAGDNNDVGEIPDIMDLANLYEWAGLSLGKRDTFTLFLSLKHLVHTKPFLKSVRVWGKILGTQRNYIVVEAELKDGVTDEDELEEPQPEPQQDEGVEGEENEEDLPKPRVKPVPHVPKESGEGVNKYVYYVCNSAGEPWSRLPDVIPEKLQLSRKIRKYFTGDLKRKIASYPPFNETEAQYLRCQIARISAATVVSPAGYYAFDQDEDQDEEDAAQPQNIVINPDYEGLSNDQLLDPANWVHHVPYLLPQGRVTWENPLANQNDADEDEDGSDDGSEGSDAGAEEQEQAEPETGPEILSPITDDEAHGETPAWVSRMCSQMSTARFSPVQLRSTSWPGATVIAYNDKFVNIYIGDGLKDASLGDGGQYAPPPLPPMQHEYEGDDINELMDPTMAEEQAFEDERKAREEDQEGSEEEEEEAEEEDEDE
ncbi:Radial spoke head protein 4 A [Gaertneriomyces sp. JEL0708]|nr:Radial spoke head protein 4 A [Gaertneriomyces sp. JEL0708]